MQTTQTLATGTTLQQGRYTIKRVLGQGGFGITYEGIQDGLNRRVAIKEFFMGSFCTRNNKSVTAPDTDAREMVGCFMEKFVKEAQLIASLDNAKHIVRIHDIFKENETAYYVMEYIDGGSLDALVRQEGPLSPKRAIHLICQVAEALQALHDRKTMHLDIKPANILLRDENDVVLIDFGVSKHYDQGGHQTTTTPVGYSKGFAPIEQYREGGVKNFSPPADIYSLGATFYYLLTGTVPPEATDLIDEPLSCPPTIAPPLWAVIEKSMKTSSKQRYQSLSEMTEALLTAEKSLPATQKAPSKPVAPKPAVTSEETKPAQQSVETRPAQPSEDVSKKEREEYLQAFYDSEASDSFKKKLSAAQTGDKDAQYSLGLDYWIGSGVKKNEDEALAWFEKAAALGHQEAKFYVHLIKANRGEANDQFLVAQDYEYGNGVTKNKQSALYWYELADYQGHIEAASCVKRLEREKLLFRILLGVGIAIVLVLVFFAIRGCHSETQANYDDIELSTLIQGDDVDCDITDNPVAAPQNPPLIDYPESNDNTIHDVVDQMPRYPGGDQKLMDYITSHIIYPERAEENGIEGRVVCQFVVEKDGSLSDITIVRSVDPDLDREAIRVVKSMDKWLPGILNHEKVRVKYTLPVKFELPECQ